MRLTDKEMEIMGVLWRSQSPMTAMELIEASDNRTWKENSIYTIMNTLVKKEAVALTHHKPTVTNTARAYMPKLKSEEYTAHYVSSIIEAGIDISIPALVECLAKIEKG